MKLDGRKAVIDKHGGLIFEDKSGRYKGFTYLGSGIFAAEIEQNKYNFLDNTGSLLSKELYTNDWLRSVSEERLSASRGGKYGFIDLSGNEIIPMIYDDAYSFSEGLAAVCKSGKWGFIDKAGMEAISLVYDQVDSSFHNGLAAASLNGKWRLIDKEGNTILPFESDDHIYTEPDGRIYVSKTVNGSEVSAYLDQNQTMLTGFKEFSLYPLSDQLYLGKKSGDYPPGVVPPHDYSQKFAIFDINGNNLTGFKYSNVRWGESFWNGFQVVNQQYYETAGLVNRYGAEVLPTIFEDIILTKEGYAFVTIKDPDMGGNTRVGYFKIPNQFAEVKGSRPVTVYLDGVELYFDSEPVIKNQRTMVPLRKVFESLGTQVEWNESTKTVTAKRGDQTIKLTIGSNTASVNGTEVRLDAQPFIQGDRTLVPLRFVSERLGAGVQWDDPHRRVVITSEGEEKKEIGIIIDGTKLTFSREDGMGVLFIDSAGRVQAPIRKALEKVGAIVSFETDAGSFERIIMISKGGSVIRLTAGNPLMRVNTDTIYQLDTSPQIIESRTYMPLRAVFEVLGYSVSWDGVIKTVKIQKSQDAPLPPSAISESSVTPVGQFDIPQYQSKAGDKPEVIVNHGYIYYLGENNDIMQTTFSNLTKSKKVYHCPGWIVNLFNDENGVPRLYYHTEGASMGSPHQFALNTDGSMKELNGGREYAGEVYSTGGRTFAFRDLFGQDPRLEMKNEAGAYVNLGGRANRYDYKSEIDGFNGRRGVYLIGDNLYLLAEPFSGDAGTAVYRVNIKTDEAVRITNRAHGLQIEGDYLYYNTGKEIRKRNLEDGTEISMYNFNNSATNFASDFAVLNGNLYIADRNSFFIAAGSEGEESPFEEGNHIISCSGMALRGDKGKQFLICQIGKTDIEKGTGSQWMRVYDKDGKLIMEREGDIRTNSVSVEEGKICYYNKTTNQINVEKIK